MTQPEEIQPEEIQPEEIQVLDQLADRLHSRFPDAPTDDIKRRVDQVHHQYDGRPVRDFIGVLIEREVVEYYRYSQQRRR